MSKIQGGLLSEHATGTVANILTFQGRRSFDHVHRKATPTDKKTTLQLRRREIFQLLIEKWQGLSDTVKQQYQTVSKLYNNNPGYNIFLTIELKKSNYWAKFSWGKFGTAYKFGGP
jgi:hypothetical protein